MRTFLPITGVILASGFAYWLSCISQPTNLTLHAIVFGVASALFSLSGGFFTAGVRKNEELSKARLDPTALDSLRRKLDRRFTRALVKLLFGLSAAILAGICSALLLRGANDARLVYLGYAALVAVLFVFLMLVGEYLFLTKQARNYERRAEQRKRDKDFREQLTSLHS